MTVATTQMLEAEWARAVRAAEKAHKAYEKALAYRTRMEISLELARTREEAAEPIRPHTHEGGWEAVSKEGAHWCSVCNAEVVWGKADYEGWSWITKEQP